MSKRKRGFPSEARVQRGNRVVHGEKELIEKLGRNDPCPCGSTRRFQTLLHDAASLRWRQSPALLSENEYITGIAGVPPAPYAYSYSYEYSYGYEHEYDYEISWVGSIDLIGEICTGIPFRNANTRG